MSSPVHNEQRTPLPLEGKSTQYCVDPKDAMRQIANWRLVMKEIMGGNFTKAIYVPLGDLQDIQKRFPKAEGVRLYLALTNMNAIGEVHAFVVPTDDEKMDMIPMEPLRPPHSNGNDEKDRDTGIYDFTQPCPNQCDETSPYFNPVEQ